jgi:hypothetical protein
VASFNRVEGKRGSPVGGAGLLIFQIIRANLSPEHERKLLDRLLKMHDERAMQHRLNFYKSYAERNEFHPLAVCQWG